jgi:hypothetical protein
LKPRATLTTLVRAACACAALVLAACGSDPTGQASTTVVDQTTTVDRTIAVDQTTTNPATAPAVVAPWRPAQDGHWQWLLDHPLRLDDPQDMGSAWLNGDGQPAAAATVFDIDGFANEAATVTALHNMGARAICYIEVGGLEPNRPDGATFPAAAIGNPVDGYPDERYLDIRSPDVVRVVLARVEMCAANGFDAIEPDLDDTFAEDTGFSLTQQDNIDFLTAVAARAHELGMSIALKNGDDPGFTEAMQPFVDFALVEQCFEFESCDAYKVFADAGKAVLEVEYNLRPDQFCPQANALSFSAVLHDPALAGGGTPCS